MNAELKSKLEKLRADFVEIGNPPFKHFYCPILYRDEEAKLCKAHIVNRAFKNSSRKWTVQREDVDLFFGSNFEADFVLLQDGRELSVIDKLKDKRFSPSFYADGTQAKHYLAKSEVPPYFTPIEFNEEGKTIHVGLKMSPKELIKSQKKQWSIDVIKDIRIASLVSLIKSAYLTLFDMMGYSYVLSAAGEFVGKKILGDFFLKNFKNTKRIVIKNANLFFKDFVHMVRPVQTCGFNFQGTISDRMVLVCWGVSGSPWAVIVFIRTGQLIHSVMLPVFDQVDMISTFLDFLKNQNEKIKVILCRYKKYKNIWESNKNHINLKWPKTGILFPCN